MMTAPVEATIEVVNRHRAVLTPTRERVLAPRGCSATALVIRCRWTTRVDAPDVCQREREQLGAAR
jgi:hypothetical protein